MSLYQRFLSIALVAIIALTTACQSGTERDLSLQTNQKAVEVIDLILETYNEINAQTYQDKYHQDLIIILTDPFPADMNMPDKDRQNLDTLLLQRKEAYRNLQLVFELYGELLNDNSRHQREKSHAAMSNSFHAIENMRNVPGKALDKLDDSTKVDMLSQSSNNRKHYLALAEITKAYHAIWLNDLPIWKEMLWAMHKTYSDGLQGIPVEVFNGEKVLELMPKQPYSDTARLVTLYKLQLRNQSSEHIRQIEQQLDAISQLLDILVETNTLLGQRNYEAEEVEFLLNRMDNILKRIDN